MRNALLVRFDTRLKHAAERSRRSNSTQTQAKIKPRPPLSTYGHQLFGQLGRVKEPQGRTAPEIYLNSISLMKRVVEDSDGWALLGILSMTRELQEERLKVVPLFLPFYKSNFAIVRPIARKLSPAAEQFIRILLQADAELSEEEAELERKYLGIVPRTSQPVDISSLKTRRRAASK
jgi:DNA-binding transcriptional LysR family regulator